MTQTSDALVCVDVFSRGDVDRDAMTSPDPEQPPAKLPQPRDPKRALHIVGEFAHGVREVAHCEIRLRDGTRLAARMWLPQVAPNVRVPAVLEYLPYRKGDGTAIDDPTRHRYFAGSGFASVRVDIRGSGDSDGELRDEYSAIELSDAAEVINWLASQAWCNGRVGMIGISWGGFNALQVAALAPAALCAVISVCSTDDRFADDAHYAGGAVLARDMLGWAMTLLALNAQPPDPATVGARWSELWQQRLDATPAFIDTWLSHPTRDDYWRHGSVCENYAAIRCPVLVVGGWADGYTNAVLRLLDGLDAPCRGIIGPWAHQYPHAGRPGPSIGFLQEAVRWWDQWLNGIDRGVMREPKLRVWLQRYTTPQPQTWPGEWLGSDLQAKAFESRELYLVDAALLHAPAATSTLTLPDDLAHGAAAGLWCPFSPADLASDQRPDDAVSALFDTVPLDADLVLLGAPALVIEIDAALPGAQVVARLCEVAPNGASLLLSWGVQVLQGTGTARVQLNAVGHRLRAGHRLRLALASSYWPVVWPATGVPAPCIGTGVSRLVLPVWRCPGTPVAFAEPECAEAAAFTLLRKGSSTTFDGGAGRRADHGRIRHANDMETDRVVSDVMTLHDGVPAIRCSRRYELARGDWQTRIEVTGAMSGDRDGFDVRVELLASLGEERWADRSWRFRIPRWPA